MKAILPTTIGLTILLTVGILGSIPTNTGELPHPIQVPSPSPAPVGKKEGCTMPSQSNVVKEQPSEELTAENVKNISKRLDSDCDGISNWDDNCPYVYNPKQEDRNKSGRGNACEKRKRPAKKNRV